MAVKIDESSRAALQAKLLRAAGFKEGKVVAIARPGKTVIYQPRVSEKEIEEWCSKMKHMVLEAKGVGREVKWVDEGYAWRKLELRDRSRR